ncbi:hypothetical protein [Butyrivibrio fibrisolvens]|uniref:hypothetical protein n=1 Tax=Butyrivibrio fibrisolvens TaxID=831 RepID=UPI0004007409|nr:hypothetical protein [Butyrivibrio fibrisolvens]
MIGMIGSTHIPPSAVMWLGDRVGNFRSWPGGNFEHERITEDSIIHEYAMKLPTFIDDVSNIDEFEDKLLVLKLMLRRIELSSLVTSYEEVMEAYAFICDSYISPFSILTMLYSHISIYVERENIMLSIASNMIEKGDVSGAFVALSLIPDPSVETRQLLDEFRKT